MIGIYKISSPTGKIYIGQSINIERRFKEYKKLYCTSQRKLYFSLKKHGVENHVFEILEECAIDILLERETYYKEFYKVLTTPSLCCRIDGKGGKNSDSTNKLISKGNKGISRNKGRKQSIEERTLRSNIKTGYKPTPTHIKNMRKSMVGKNTKPIICINTNEKYSSIREASNKLGLNERSIGNNLIGLSKNLKNGLKFKYC